MKRLLVVGHDEGIAGRLVDLFDASGFHADLVSTGEQTIAQVSAIATDVVIVNLRLADTDGVELCRALRRNGFAGGVLMVGDQPTEVDVVAGLDAGADDFLTQPYPIAELQSRVRAVLRRIHRADTPPESAHANGLEVHPHVITYAGQTILTQGREYHVLACLLEAHGRVLTREDLMERVWGSDWTGSPVVLAAAISRIRVRLAAAGAPHTVENVRGIGFRCPTEP